MAEQTTGIMSSEQFVKIKEVITISKLSDENKQWWISKLPSLDKVQLKKLWKIFHATPEELKFIIKNETILQKKLKNDLEKLVKDGVNKVYQIAEHEEQKLEEIALEQLMKEEGII